MKMNYEMVDLGLPSGLKWAKCNLGADTETGYGDYFMFGSVEPDTDKECGWTNAPFNNGSSSYDSSYFTTHKSEWFNGDILKTEYDAAAQIMGSGWRMPTIDDIQELIDGTTNSWTTVDGVKGYKFVNKSDSSKYIFIPASGYRDGSSVGNVDSNGGVWSSSLYSSDLSSARYLFFSSINIFVDDDDRYYGCSVRGVYDEN